MNLKDFGYSPELEKYRKENKLDTFVVGRVILEHKDRYTVLTENGELVAELIGQMRFSAHTRNDLPVVGDWVTLSEYDVGKALIHHLFPRKTILERKAVGKHGLTQIIATNIDTAIIIQSVNRDLSINRLERYLTICHASRIEPIIVLSKIDLISSSQLDELIRKIKQRIKQVEIIAISNLNQMGIDKIESLLIKGQTYCLLGSSGVGKSSLINSITKNDMMKTGEISTAIDRGKHITTHRELIVLENGVLIDNPGMREIGITESSSGLEMTFDEILNLSESCKFKDCTHTNEKGCAVTSALYDESLSAELYENFQKLEKEKSHFEANSLERKKKDKELGKMIKQMKKNRKNNKY